MTDPIAAPKAVSAIITVQALSPAATHRESTLVQSAIAMLTDGTVVSGYVVNRDRNNNPILRTSQGDFVVESEVFIKTGSEVVFRVDPSVASRARIVTIDNLSPEDYSVQAAMPGITEDTITPSSLNAAQTVSSSGQTTVAAPLLTAVVLQSLSPASTAQAPATAVAERPVPAGLTQLAPGTPVGLTLLDIKLPPLPVAVQSLAFSPAATAQFLPPAASLPQLAETETANTLLPPTLQAQATAAPNSVPQSGMIPNLFGTTNPAVVVAPPAMGGSAPPAAVTTVSGKGEVPGFVVEASVIGHGEDGANIVHTPFATLKLFTEQPLPTGTILTVKAETGTAAPLSPPLTEFSELPLPSAGLPLSNFAYLSQAIVQLMATDPSVARAVMAQLPSIGPKFTSGLAFFLSAVKGGSVRDLFNSRTLSQLEALAPELLSRLSSDLTTLNQSFNNSPLADWKAIPLPLIFGNAAEPATLYVRKDGEGQGTAERGSIGQRFLIDITLSEMGALQFDGFVRHEGGTKALELFLRSQTPLDPAVSNGIRQTFDTALKTTGLHGQLVFQHGPERFVRPKAALAAPDGGVAAHTILA